MQMNTWLFEINWKIFQLGAWLLTKVMVNNADNLLEVAY